MRPRGSPPMPSATSSAIDPVGTTSTGARSSLPSRMTEPLPNCRSIWASAVSSAFSRSAGVGIVWLPFAGTVVLNRCFVRYVARVTNDVLGRPEVDNSLRAGLWPQSINTRTFLRMSEGRVAPAFVLVGCPTGALTPGFCSPDDSPSPRLWEAGAVPALDGHLHRLAEGEPHVTLRYAFAQCLVTRAVSELVDHQVAQQRPAVLFAEF